MAASLSRPDPSSPASVAEAGFSTTRRGFNQDEVRAFLTSVAAELGRLQERERQLQAQLEDLDAKVALTPELDEEAVAAMLGDETLRVLQTARESASQIKIRAEESAAKILGDANDEANRLRQEAELEAARKRHDAASDAEAEVALAKQQGREMVNEARSYRERVLADLERRTNLARQQIEELLHGRDRLLQVFERARLVAVDVTSELQAIDGPDELVNLSPTTGPLPIMVPTDDRPSEVVSTPEVDDASVSETAKPFDGAASEPVDGADPADDDAEAVVEVADDTDDADDDAAAVTDIDGDDANHDDDAVDEPPAALRRDANVVSLFRDREHQPDADADADPDGGEEAADPELVDADADADADADSEHDVDDTDDASKPDVGDIFERLRSETPDTPEMPVATTEPASEADGAEDAEVDDGPVDTAFSRRDEVLTPLIVAGARKLKRVLADEQNGVLDQLRGKHAVTELADVIPEVDEHAEMYRAALDDELLEAAVSGAGEAGKNDTKTLRTTLRKGALDASHTIVRDDLVQPLRERLERAIHDGGGDNDDITKRVRAVYREWKTQHIDGQLDDAFRFAYGGGLAAGVKPGTELVWTIDPSHGTCPDCEDNSLSGAVQSGEPFPTGHTLAPAHAGCRCLTLPAGT